MIDDVDIVLARNQRRAEVLRRMWVHHSRDGGVEPEDVKWLLENGAWPFPLEDVDLVEKVCKVLNEQYVIAARSRDIRDAINSGTRVMAGRVDPGTKASAVRVTGTHHHNVPSATQETPKEKTESIRMFAIEKAIAITGRAVTGPPYMRPHDNSMTGIITVAHALEQYVINGSAQE